MLKILILVVAQAFAQSGEFEIIREMVVMSDGVEIATTLMKPKSSDPNAKFPVIIEMQPYRKDDLFLARDYALHSYFARSGYVMIKADVRGTGSSRGKIQDREYSALEIRDAEELINHYAKVPWSTGNVGMWGISWSGFNALMTAMRNPPALKAVIAAHSSDDLFHDDVHFIDGAFHVDEYELSIENDLSVPRSPDYKLDAEYFNDRFDVEPWFLRYKREQKDGPFWQEESVRGQYHRLKTPVLLIGGLLDGYRDTLARLLDHSAGPVKAILGPWNHSWPHDSQPCPCFEWREDALKWWDFYLKEKGAPPRDRQIHVFQRAGDAPSVDLQQFTGSWYAIQWNERQKNVTELYLSSRGRLTPALESRTGVMAVPYVPSNGRATGFWWGELTPDMVEDDGSKLTFDSEPLTEKLELMGVPELLWQARTSAPWATWSVQLEDVFPDGKVAMVTGAVKNSSQDASRTEPRGSAPHTLRRHTLPLHFTTWTFQPGHRIRVTVSHAQFPMIWPMPFHVSSQLFTGTAQSLLRLPLLPPDTQINHQLQLPPRPVQTYPGLTNEGGRWPYENRTERDTSGKFSVLWKADSSFHIDGREHYFFEETTHATHDERPWNSQFTGRAGHTIRLPGRDLRFSTDIQIDSDKKFFHVTFTRKAFENGVNVRSKTWRESIRRRYH